MPWHRTSVTPWDDISVVLGRFTVPVSALEFPLAGTWYLYKLCKASSNCATLSLSVIGNEILGSLMSHVSKLGPGTNPKP